MDTTEPVTPSSDEECRPSETEELIERLLTENEDLRRELAEVVGTAATNERIWRHFVEIERILWRTRDVEEVARELLREIQARFKPEKAILLLSHPDLLERFFPDLTEEGKVISEGAWILPFASEAGASLCGNTCGPILFTPETMGKLLAHLPENFSDIQSGVLVPFCIHQIHFGGLFLGSVDANRYEPSVGTDLLDQLGSKVALCLDNCLTYEKVKSFSLRDPLTGLLNFFQTHTVLEREFRKARREETPLSILVIGLDFVREIMEDPFGIGNDVLKHVADMLNGLLPKGEAVLGRYGSDEFLMILPGVDENEAHEVVPFFTDMIRKSPYKAGNAVILVQASIGTATMKAEMERPQDLLDDACADLCRIKLGQGGPAGEDDAGEDEEDE